MIEYCVDGNYFEKLQLLSSAGRESNVYLDLFTYNMPMCIKKYKSSFWYDCSNDEALKKMFLLQEKLAGLKNIFPSIVFKAILNLPVDPLAFLHVWRNDYDCNRGVIHHVPQVALNIFS